ncbi:MAG: bifunctional hydroxymethylpyrimidine kinase/phosphomethylpyrimidine kinase [bacterium]|jgi:hydroxymethylpyrimidine/phosphomethylpyrimidine kinase
MEDIRVPTALTIAGSDSGGGAGIEADLRTFAALKVFGTAALTLITAQNTRDVFHVEMLPPWLVGKQIDAVMSDFAVGAAKTGALGTAEIVAEVAGKIKEHSIENLVVDPVMISKHGSRLIEQTAAEALMKLLCPLATIITPNAHEAAAMLDTKVENLGDPGKAALELCRFGSKYVLLKGGHLNGSDAVDYFSDGNKVHEIRAPRVDSPHTHGTGCTLSSAIAAFLARGFEVKRSVCEAKHFVSTALRFAVPVGGGISPVHHMHEYYQWGGE